MDETQPFGQLSPVVAGMLLFTCIAIGIFVLAAMWKVFTKAGEPGWAAIIPIYNMIVMLRIIGRPLWWIVLFFIPLINFIVAIVVYIDLAKSFGKGVGFGLGLVFLQFIFFPILGFGDARYIGPAGGSPGTRFDNPPLNA